MNPLITSAFTGVFTALLLSACGGGGVDDAASAIAPAEPARDASATIEMEGCVMDHNFIAHHGSVRALYADGRVAATGSTNANGVFVLRVPAQTTLRVELEASDPQALNVLTGQANFSIGACWMAEHAAVADHDDPGDTTLPESVAMPVIRSHPKALTVALGQPARFSVSAEWRKPLRYQWRRNGTDLAGANGPSLMLAATQPADQAEYSVVVSNVFAAIASNKAALRLTSGEAPQN